MTIPYIDPNVKHVPISYLRKLNADVLKQETRTLVVDGFDGEAPLAVILPYGTFIAIQNERGANSQTGSESGNE